MNALAVVAGHSGCPCSLSAPADLQMKLTLQQDVPKSVPSVTCCLVGIFGHCIAQIPYLLSMLIAQNCTKVLTFVTHRKLAFHMPHNCCHSAPLHYPVSLSLPLPTPILRIFQLQFAELFNDKLPNVSDSTSNYAIVCSVQALHATLYSLPSPGPAQFRWSGPFEWPSKNVFTIHCSTCLLGPTCRYSRKGVARRVTEYYVNMKLILFDYVQCWLVPVGGRFI